jgi:hypothetical protein
MINPTLSLNFTSAALDSRVAFTRAGNTATRINPSGLIEGVVANTARFDFNPVTLACNGLLIEEQRVNFSTYSEEFNNAVWAKTNMNVTQNSTVAPDGASTADKLIPTTTNALHIVAGATTTPFTTGSSYTASVYAKRSELSILQISFSSAAIPLRANFDLLNGTLGSVDVGITAQIISMGDGWYRCIATGTSAATGSYTSVFAIVPIASSGRFAGSIGNDINGLFVWGAQLEAGSFATSYIPTVATTVTRNADVATITGTNFSDWWQAGKGGAQVQAIPSTVSGIRPLVQFDDNTANEIIALRGNTTNPELYIVDGGTPQAQLDAGTIAANTAYSLTGWWQTNDCKASKDSGAVVTDTTASIPTVTQARIGSDGTNYLNGTIATIGYYDSLFGQPIYTRRKNKVFPSLL